MGAMAGMNASQRDKASALNKALKGMFKALQSRPVPGRLRSVVDQLDEGDQADVKKQGRG